jgi:hypothetical protein
MPANFRLWHLAGVRVTLANVRFEGKNRHEAVVTPFPLMTHSGPCRRKEIGLLTAKTSGLLCPADNSAETSFRERPPPKFCEGKKGGPNG